MQNPTQKFRQGSIVFEKLDILPEKMKILSRVLVEVLHHVYQDLNKIKES